MKKIILVFLISAFILNVFGQECYNFFYTKTYAYADFNSTALDSVAYELMDCNCLMNVKFIEGGDYTIMQYERYRYGELYIDTFGFVRDIVLIKVIDGFIVESYYIPCDWREPPITAVILYSNKRFKFSKKIRLKKLKLKNIGLNIVNILDSKGSLKFPITHSIRNK